MTTVGVYNIYTHPKCVELKDTYMRLYSIDIYDIETFVPGVLYIYYKINVADSNYYGQTNTLELMEAIGIFVGKMSLGTEYRLEGISDTDGNYTQREIYADYPDGTSGYVGNVWLLNNVYDTKLMWCGCSVGDIKCGDCCVNCCEIASVTKNFYENILS